MPTLVTVKGQNLIDLCNSFLGGYQNAVDPDVMLAMLNEGKNEVWTILKGLRADYFITSTVPANSNPDPSSSVFGPMLTTQREYVLPSDFREMKFIEILDPGYEDTSFVFRDMSSPEFKDLRRSSTNHSSQNSDGYQFHYDIVGMNILVLAEYPAFAYQQPIIWYVRMLPDFRPGDVLDQILYPYTSKIAIYAAKMCLLTLQDQPMWQSWRDEWEKAIKTIAGSAGPRQISDPQFVESFDGTPSDG